MTKAFHLHFSADTDFTQFFLLMLITFGSYSLHEKIVLGNSRKVILTSNSSSEQLKLKPHFTVFVVWFFDLFLILSAADVFLPFAAM